MRACKNRLGDGSCLGVTNVCETFVAGGGPGARAGAGAGRPVPVHNVELFIALLAGVVVLVWLAGPLRVPYPVVLVLGGLAVGLLPFLPNVKMEPDFVLLAFLPPILYRAAWTFAAEDVRMSWAPIVLLAVGLVLVDDRRGGHGRPRPDRRALGARVRARRDPRPDGPHRRHLGHPPPRRAGADGDDPRGGEPGQRRLGHHGVPHRGRRDGGGGVPSGRRRRRVRGRRGRRPRARRRARVRRDAAAAAPGGRGARDHRRAAHRLRRLRPRRARRRVRHPRRRGGRLRGRPRRPVHGSGGARAGDGVLEDPGLRRRVDAVPARRPRLRPGARPRRQPAGTDRGGLAADHRDALRGPAAVDVHGALRGRALRPADRGRPPADRSRTSGSCSG